MALTDSIKHILVLPGVGPVRRKLFDSTQALPQFQPAALVGLELDDGHIAWGDCLLTEEPILGVDEAETRNSARRTIEEVVAPVLVGRQLTDFRELAASLDGLTETRWALQEVPSQEERKRNISRTDFITGQFLNALQQEGTPQRRRARVSRPLSSEIRFGVTQALLAAFAHIRQTCEAQVVLDEYGLDRIDAPVPIHVELDEVQAGTLVPLMLGRAVSLGYTMGESNLKEDLLRSFENLIRYVRLLLEQTPDLFGEAYRPVVHVNVRGAFGKAHGGQAGKILGDIYNLEQKSRHYPTRVEDPAVMDTLEEQVQLMKQVGSYARSRKMVTEIAAGAWVESNKAVAAFLDADATGFVHIDPLRMGGVHHIVEAVLACRKAGVQVMLGGSPAETQRCAQTTAQIAVAARPDLVMAKPSYQGDVAMTYTANAMARALAQMRAISARN